MNPGEILTEISTWPIESQIELVRGAWDQIVERGAEPGFPKDHIDELNRRLDELEANPNDYLTLEQLLVRVGKAR